MTTSEYLEKIGSLKAALNRAIEAEGYIKDAIAMQLREQKKAEAMQLREQKKKDRENRVCRFCGSSDDYYAKGLCRRCYSRALRNGGDPAYRHKKVPPPPPPPYDWRIRLRNDVLGAEAENVSAPTDIDASVDYALSTLRDRERYVVLARYRDRATLREIGDQNGFTRERARQIIVKSLGRLRRPITRQCLLVGITEAKRLEQEKAEAAKRLEQEKAEAAMREYAAREEAKSKAIACGNVGIEHLDTSVRAYNILARDYWGKNKGLLSDRPTIAHYLNLRYRLGEAQFYEYLMSLRGMGAKSAENVIASLDRWSEEHGSQKEGDSA